MSTLRQQRQEQTRAALLAMGEQEVVRVGAGKVSIRKVCQAAGYTLGAFYSNFKSRDEFLLTILDNSMTGLFASMRELVDRTIVLGVSSSQQNLVNWVEDLRANVLRSGLMLEFIFYARHDEEFRAAFTPFITSWREQTAGALRRLFTGLGLRPRLSCHDMALLLSATWQGLMLQENLHTQDGGKSTSDLLVESIMNCLKTAEPADSGRD